MFASDGTSGHIFWSWVIKGTWTPMYLLFVTLELKLWKYSNHREITQLAGMGGIHESC